MARKPLTAVTPSSGNVFADIGVSEPDEDLAKAQLASRIRVVQEAATAALKWVVAEKDRSALARRLKRGRVVYQSDPTGSGFTERIEPDGTRTLGRLMNRRFVPARSAGSRAR